MQRLSLTLLLLISILINGAIAQSIKGDNKVCLTNCYQYVIEGGSGGPYYWSADNASFFSNKGDTVEICWIEVGNISLQVIDLSAEPASQILSMPVDISPEVNPSIIFPLYPDCNPSDSSGYTGQDFNLIACKKVCPNSIMNFRTKYELGNDYQWHVEGGDITVISDAEVEIKWGDSGFGLIKVIESNSAGCIDSSQFCIEFLPESNISIEDIHGNAGPAEICLGQDIYLNANSSESLVYEWQTSDGQISAGSNAKFSFDSPGNYTISLIGRTPCYCPDTSYFNVVVDPFKGPEIGCTGTICTGEEATYYALDDCSNYIWSISTEGQITEGGTLADDYVKVKWNNGHIGIVSLETDNCSSNICDKPTTVVIPIIDQNLQIQGNTISCKSGQQVYSVNSFNGVEYSWNIQGNGTIISGFGSEEIIVEWGENSWDPDTALISLYYENCFLGCGDYTEIKVDLKKKFQLAGEFQICENVQTFFNSQADWIGVNCNWEIYSPEGILVETILNESYINPTFTNGPGIYYIKATSISNDYCNTYVDGIVEVSAQPEAPKAIEGPLSVCKNTLYQYETTINNPETYLKWEVTDGSSSQIYYVDQLTLEWKSDGPYSIKVTNRDLKTNCESPPTEINPLLINAVNLEGNFSICTDNIGVYEIPGAKGSEVQWEITPSNAGTIFLNENGQVDILWHLPGTHVIKATYCAMELTSNVTVVSNAILGDHNATICEGDFATITLPVHPGSYEVTNDAGDFISSNQTFTTGPGHYLITYTSLEGCVSKETFEIIEAPKPSISISTPEETGFCPPHPAVNLYALNTEEGLIYQWYKDGLPFGGNTSILSSNEFGSYHVEVTDINGCKAISNSIALFEWCQGGGFCTGGTCNLSDCDSDGNISFDAIGGIFCNEFEFKNTSIGGISGSYQYLFDDPASGVDNSSTLENPSHTFTRAGHYVVILLGDVISNTPPPFFCQDWDYKIITVPVAADFDSELSCPGEGMNFRDLSSFIAGRNITSWEWDFGDPASGLDNFASGKNPSHIFNIPGKYNVTLTITADSGCKSKITKEVSVLDSPPSTFRLPFERCTDQALQFQADTDDQIISYNWDFGDAASPATNNSFIPSTLHEYANPGIYSVSLLTKNIYDCTTSEVKNIEVSDNSISGDITANLSMPICYGEYVVLEAPIGGLAYFWSNGETGQQISVSEPGIYYVTITSSQACDYVPEPIQVSVENTPDINIIGYTYKENPFIGEANSVRIEICEGEVFDLRCNYIFGATYTWSHGSSTSYYLSYSELSSLSPGSHMINVTVNDPQTGCIIESDELEVLIHAKPQNIIIESSSSDYCEGSIIQFNIKNPDPSLLYYWNNGVQGTSIEIGTPGPVFVTAVNSFGCESKSNILSIYPSPDISKVTRGCVPVCFPDTICLPTMPDITSFTWYKDGIEFANTKDLPVTEIGEYELVMENYYGCKDTSYVLSLELKDGDKNMEGKVFIDANKNGIYDAGDILLDGVPVSLSTSSGILETVQTGTLGDYSFKQIDEDVIIINIDTIGLGLDLASSSLSTQWTFTKCIENANLDFPLILNCASTTYNVQMETCHYESLVIDGIELWTGDEHTFNYLDIYGCDSIVVVEVESYLEPNYSIQATNSCLSASSGIIEILNGNGSILNFSLNGSSFSTMNIFNELSPATYDLTILDEYGCEYEEIIEIENNQLLEANFSDPSIPCGSEKIEMGADLISHTGTVQYQWNNGSTSQSLSVSTSGVYAVTITDNCSELQNTWTIDFESASQDLNEIDLPNTFSPNGDGINDTFKPYNIAPNKIRNYMLEVFDRWGNKVYKSTSLNDGWNGMYKGAMGGLNVYVYQMYAEQNLCDEWKIINKVGDVTIVK